MTAPRTRTTVAKLATSTRTRKRGGRRGSSREGWAGDEVRATEAPVRVNWGI